MKKIDDITGIIIGDAIAVHRMLGPGLLESTYEHCLHLLLTRRGLNVQHQVRMPLIFEGERLGCAFRLDLLVEERVVVEVKSVSALTSLHLAQVKTYLRLSGCTIGLLINFNVLRLAAGLRRIVLTDEGRGPPPVSELPVKGV